MKKNCLYADKGLWGAPLYCFETLPSTQTWAREHASTLQHGSVVRARSQTDGYGRFGRPWVSAPDAALAFSIALKSDAAQWHGGFLCSCVATAVCATLRDVGAPVLLKWPNDVVGDCGKIAGLLAENMPETGTLFLGVGVNVNQSKSALAAIPAAAYSLRIACGRHFETDSLLGALLTQIERALDDLALNGPQAALSFWSRHDALCGQRVTLYTADGRTVTGAYGGLTAEGALRIEDEAGAVSHYWSGDVSLSAPGERRA